MDVKRNADERRPPLVVLVGPTAVGKTAMAVEVALRANGEIVSADSMQVYRGLDIGTDKPSQEERRGVPHHLIDVRDPNQPFNAAEYRSMAHKTIADIHARGRLPILSGGTGLYVKAVLDEFLFPATGANPSVRSELEREARELGEERLHQRLSKVDPATAKRLHKNDVRRVIRALEVYVTTGVPLSKRLVDAAGKPPRYSLAMFGLTRPRESLYRRIEARVDDQIRRGLIQEVQSLMDRWGDLPVARQALGYKEIASYLKGDIALDQAIERLKRDTRRYAKRQYTWFGKDSRLRWIDVEAVGEDKAVDIIVEEIKGKLELKDEIPHP